jgi:hypothetical protein
MSKLLNLGSKGFEKSLSAEISSRVNVSRSRNDMSQ